MSLDRLILETTSFGVVVLGRPFERERRQRKLHLLGQVELLRRTTQQGAGTRLIVASLGCDS